MTLSALNPYICNSGLPDPCLSKDFSGLTVTPEVVRPPTMFRAASASSESAVCLRCGKTVYPTDKIGPLKDFTFFHSGCFRCVVCGTKLTLRTYLNNQGSQTDKEVYCSQHVPKIGPGRFDGESMGIKSAMNAPKSGPYVNEQIR